MLFRLPSFHSEIAPSFAMSFIRVVTKTKFIKFVIVLTETKKGKDMARKQATVSTKILPPSTASVKVTDTTSGTSIKTVTETSPSGQKTTTVTTRRGGGGGGSPAPQETITMTELPPETLARPTPTPSNPNNINEQQRQFVSSRQGEGFTPKLTAPQGEGTGNVFLKREEVMQLQNKSNVQMESRAKTLGERSIDVAEKALRIENSGAVAVPASRLRQKTTAEQTEEVIDNFIYGKGTEEEKFGRRVYAEILLSTTPQGVGVRVGKQVGFSTIKFFGAEQRLLTGRAIQTDLIGVTDTGRIVFARGISVDDVTVVTGRVATEKKLRKFTDVRANISPVNIESEFFGVQKGKSVPAVLRRTENIDDILKISKDYRATLTGSKGKSLVLSGDRASINEFVATSITTGRRTKVVGGTSLGVERGTLKFDVTRYSGRIRRLTVEEKELFKALPDPFKTIKLPKIQKSNLKIPKNLAQGKDRTPFSKTFVRQDLNIISRKALNEVVGVTSQSAKTTKTKNIKVSFTGSRYGTSAVLFGRSFRGGFESYLSDNDYGVFGNKVFQLEKTAPAREFQISGTQFKSSTSRKTFDTLSFKQIDVQTSSSRSFTGVSNRQPQRQGNRTVLRELNIVSPREIITFKEIQAFRQPQRTPTRTSAKRTPIIKTPKFPRVPKGTPKVYKILSPKDFNVADPFKVSVKRRGKDREIFETSDFSKATKKLSDKLRRTLGASGFITQGGKRVRFDLGKQFRFSKKDPLRVIQKSKYRLSTKSEVKEIQGAKLSRRYRL